MPRAKAAPRRRARPAGPPAPTLRERLAAAAEAPGTDPLVREWVKGLLAGDEQPNGCGANREKRNRPRK